MNLAWPKQSIEWTCTAYIELSLIPFVIDDSISPTNPFAWCSRSNLFPITFEIIKSWGALVKDFIFSFEFVVHWVKKESKGGKGRDGDREKKMSVPTWMVAMRDFRSASSQEKEENKEKKRKLPVTSPRQRHVRQWWMIAALATPKRPPKGFLFFFSGSPSRTEKTQSATFCVRVSVVCVCLDGPPILPDGCSVLAP